MRFEALVLCAPYVNVRDMHIQSMEKRIEIEHGSMPCVYCGIAVVGEGLLLQFHAHTANFLVES